MFMYSVQTNSESDFEVGTNQYSGVSNNNVMILKKEFLRTNLQGGTRTKVRSARSTRNAKCWHFATFAPQEMPYSARVRRLGLPKVRDCYEEEITTEKRKANKSLFIIFCYTDSKCKQSQRSSRIIQNRCGYPGNISEAHRGFIIKLWSISVPRMPYSAAPSQRHQPWLPVTHLLVTPWAVESDFAIRQPHCWCCLFVWKSVY